MFLSTAVCFDLQIGTGQPARAYCSNCNQKKMCTLCGRCETTNYCSAACQVLHYFTNESMNQICLFVFGQWLHWKASHHRACHEGKKSVNNDQCESFNRADF